MFGRLSLPLVVVAATVAAAACGGDGPRDSTAPEGTRPGTVVVDDMRYSPDEVEIDSGEIVTWSFEGRMVHDVEFHDGVASTKMRTGTWQRRFDASGTYDYLCTIHPIMTGTVTVN